MKLRRPKIFNKHQWQHFVDLPVPAAIVDVTGNLHYKNPAWADLDPLDARAFNWPISFSERVQESIELQRSTVVRAVATRRGSDAYDLWIGPVDNTQEYAIIVAADVSTYYQDGVKSLIDAELKNASILVRGLLHEMRNPLAGIRGGLQLLQRRNKDNPGLNKDIDQVLADVQRIDGLFNELVVLGGALTLRKLPTNLHRVIDEAIANVTATASSQKIEIKRDLDPSLPDLAIDSDWMYRVYLNLLINALQASPENARIEVRTRFKRIRWAAASLGSGNLKRAAWVTEIRDNGVDIDRAVRAQLFTPLFTTKKQGSGLGLPISLQVVQAHGGWLTLDNHAEGGALATVVLPIG